MRKLDGTLMAFGIALMLLIFNCEAAEPVQLSGTGGQTILAQVASTNITNQVTKASADDRLILAALYRLLDAFFDIHYFLAFLS